MVFDLKKALENYVPKTEEERESLKKTQEFLETQDNCYSRTNLEGHITSGALVIDKDFNVLLNHHKIFDSWFHFGGHSDGEADSLNVARREVMEESGVVDVDVCGGKIFDIDVHSIPYNEKKKEPEHYHYDIRFLFIAKNKEFKISDESKDIRWLTIEEAKKIATKQDMIRMLDKLEELKREKEIEKDEER